MSTAAAPVRSTARRSRPPVSDWLSIVISGRSPWASHVLTAPAVFWLVTFLILPLLLVVAISFTQRGPYGVLVWRWTLENYARALTPTYLPVLFRSIGYAAFTTALCLIVGFPVAYTLSFYVKGNKGLWVLLLMLPFWTSCLVSIYSWMI